ncbi:hypothetical protein B0H11DRAFT_1264161 [Mycena galericulata]|nr:hypothetical protein B0H11DRAFT_1264161 [Mycena galericulata]
MALLSVRSAPMSSVTSIPELVIQVLEYLPLRDLISASHVDQQWRALVPNIDSPTRSRLLGLAFKNVESIHPISLSVRTSYVDKVESKYTVIIPEPYRTILTEWPASQAPPGMHWPHSVRFHASGFCFCPRQVQENPEVCVCADAEVIEVAITIPGNIFKIVMDEARVPDDEDEPTWELFNNPVRLYTEEQNVQTMRFIRAHPVEEFQWTGRRMGPRPRPGWARFFFKVLKLSRYAFHTKMGHSEGTFVMILEGPTRGQIHGWSFSGRDWYAGFEAESFWDWNYREWDRDAVYPTTDSD